VQDLEHCGKGNDPPCMLYRAKQCELGAQVGKPVPVEPKARDAEKIHCESGHGAEPPHAVFERDDPSAQEGLDLAFLPQRGYLIKATTDPRPRCGRLDPQLGE